MKTYALFRISGIILLAGAISIATLTLVYLLKDPNPTRIFNLMIASK